ncbi:hypothetical protein BBP40_008212 [Aspergillus hancockii]|nr:hypothetical protein BBP40_008212 [Aspergillus hancockii]
MDLMHTDRVAATIAYHSSQENQEDAPRAAVPRNIGLGLTRSYAANWQVQDALRELYQNWKDAIVQRHHISLPDFAPKVLATRDKTQDEIRILVEELPVQPQAEGEQQASVPALLGYIRFDRKRGSAEFTNFHATLDFQCLEMGHTTKKDNEKSSSSS